MAASPIFWHISYCVVYKAYDEGGFYSALKVLGVEVACFAAGGVIVKMSAPYIKAALQLALAKNPGLAFVLDVFVDRLAVEVERFLATHAGKTLQAAVAVLERPLARGIERGMQKIDGVVRKTLDRINGTSMIEKEAKAARATPIQQHIDQVTGVDRASARTQLFGTDNVAEFSNQRVRQTNGRMPINSDYAGKIYTFDLLPPSTKLKYPNLIRDYPHGIHFNGSGYPDFSRYAINKVEINPTGLRWKDDLLANKAVNLRNNPTGYTWHHHEDGKSMLLIPTDLHDAIKHSGGFSKIFTGK